MGKADYARWCYECWGNSAFLSALAFSKEVSWKQMLKTTWTGAQPTDDDGCTEGFRGALPHMGGLCARLVAGTAKGQQPGCSCPKTSATTTTSFIPASSPKRAGGHSSMRESQDVFLKCLFPNLGKKEWSNFWGKIPWTGMEKMEKELKMLLLLQIGN